MYALNGKLRHVQIAMVHGGHLEWPTVQSLIRTLADDSAERRVFTFTQTESLYVPAGRQSLATRFLGDPTAEWLFFIDSDISWSLDDAYRLLDSADPMLRPVVMGVVFLNGPAGIRAAGWMEGEQEVPWQDGGMVEVAVVGTGFTIYHRRVLQGVQDRHDTMFAEAWEGQRFFGEDVAFSYRARECGIPLHMNCDVKVGHVKRVMLDEGWARASQEMRAR